MSFLAEAHNQWHSIHGQKAVCPLDCGAGEDPYEDWEDFDPDPQGGGQPVEVPAPLWTDPWINLPEPPF